MNWVLEHMGDADFNDPLPAPGATAAAAASPAADAAGAAAADPESLVMLTSLGFTDRQASAALKATGGDAARGADWLFSHTDDLDKAVAEVQHMCASMCVCLLMARYGCCMIHRSLEGTAPSWRSWARSFALFCVCRQPA